MRHKQNGHRQDGCGNDSGGGQEPPPPPSRKRVPEELAAHAPLIIRDRPWGSEAIVQQFDAARFAVQAQGLDLAAEAVPLEEIFLSLVGESGA